MRNRANARVFVDPTLADFEERGHVVDGEDLVQLRLRGGRGGFGRHVVSHGVLTSAQGKLHQYTDGPFRIATKVTRSRR
jgi:hypothetical protein